VVEPRSHLEGCLSRHSRCIARSVVLSLCLSNWFNEKNGLKGRAFLVSSRFLKMICGVCEHWTFLGMSIALDSAKNPDLFRRNSMIQAWLAWGSPSGFGPRTFLGSLIFMLHSIS
jgi:hypothetical protein